MRERISYLAKLAFAEYPSGTRLGEIAVYRLFIAPAASATLLSGLHTIAAKIKRPARGQS